MGCHFPIHRSLQSRFFRESKKIMDHGSPEVMFGGWTWTSLSPCVSRILEFLLQVKYHSIAVVRKQKTHLWCFPGIEIGSFNADYISDLQRCIFFILYMRAFNRQQIIGESGCICQLHLLKNHSNNIMDLSIYAVGPPTKNDQPMTPEK